MEACVRRDSHVVFEASTCSRDLRFEPMANVSKAHVIMQQAASHTHAGFILAGACCSVEFARYEDVVKYYASDLGTLSDP